MYSSRFVATSVSRLLRAHDEVEGSQIVLPLTCKQSNSRVTPPKKRNQYLLGSGMCEHGKISESEGRRQIGLHVDVTLLSEPENLLELPLDHNSHTVRKAALSCHPI